MSDHVGEPVHFTPGGGQCMPAVTTSLGQYQARNLAVHDENSESVAFISGVEWDGDLNRMTYHRIGEGDCPDDEQKSD